MSPEPAGNHDGSGDEPRALVRDLAHELRDALSPVASSIDLMRLRNFDPDTALMVAAKVDRALKRAFATVDAFVLAEQCERGTLQLQIERCDLSQVLQAVREALPGELSTRCAFAPLAAAVEVSADRVRTLAVVTAMLQYACTIASAGSPVAVHIEAGDSRPAVRVRTRLDPELAPGSEWFAGYLPAVAGGMALRTARRLMTLQHGDLELLAPARGECELVATFADRSRTDPPSSSAARLPAGASGAGDRTVTRLMIVDDSVDVRRAYSEALAALGYVVIEASNAQEALRSLEGEAPQVALIDIHLPGMNGYRLVQAMRARAGTAIRLIMLSGMTLDAVTQRLSREAGFDACLDKMAGPLGVHQLLSAPRPA